MLVSGGGFEQAYNAQAGVEVDAGSMLVVATGVTQTPNDKEQIAPMLQTLQAQAPQLGSAKTLIADTDYCSEKNIVACEQANTAPLIAMAREDHHPHWSERHSEPASLPKDATPLQTMAHTLKTLVGAASYALRRANGGAGLWDHQVRDGLSSVLTTRIEDGDGGWDLVFLAWNVKRMTVLRLKTAERRRLRWEIAKIIEIEANMPIF